MPEYFYLDSTTPLIVTATRQEEKRIANGGDATIYYKATSDVSSTSYDGTIASKASHTVNAPVWIIAATQTNVVVSDVDEYEFHSSESVTSHEGGVTINPGRSVFRVDESGNVLIGPNELIYNASQQSFVGWTEGRSAPDLAYDSHTRRIYTRSIIVHEVGDPPDLLLGRFGGTYPLGTGTSTGTAADLTGVPANTSLGKLSFRGGITPGGGTPDVTGGSSMSGATSAIYGRNAEILTSTAQGGNLVFQTTPIGSTTIADVARFASTGKLELGANFDANLYSVSGTLTTDSPMEVKGVTAATWGFFSSSVDASPAFKANVPAGNALLSNRLLPTDANSSFRILGDGRVLWGAGGASATDITMRRRAADYLSVNVPFGGEAVSAPADASLSASQFALYLDDTNGAGKLMVKGKTANGTVVSGSVTLA